MSALAILPAAVEEAAERIAPYVRETYVESSADLGELTSAEVLLKLENLQHTGSFKVRGALNKILSLTPEERERGVLAASTGNHGAAVAYALATTGASGVVFVPENASAAKIEMIERLGAKVERVPGDPLEGEKRARRLAADTGRAYVSPYNDWQVIAGQGTVGFELARQCGDLDAVVVALGGGGLLSGTGGYLKSLNPRIQVIACSPENSAVMVESVKAGRILELPSRPTLSDGTAGGVEAGALTFELVRDLVDDFVTVSEKEIRAALRRFLASHRMLIEGAAAAAIAGFVQLGSRFAGQRVAVVLCGGNIGAEDLKNVLE